MLALRDDKLRRRLNPMSTNGRGRGQGTNGRDTMIVKGHGVQIHGL